MTPSTRKPYTVIALRHGGTHLIIPVVRYLTGKTVYSPKGADTLTCVPSDKVIVFLRDPRNWLVSAYKWKHGSTPSDEGLSRFMVAKKKGETPLGFVRKWAERWVGWPGALTVRYEDMTPGPRGIQQVARVASFLDAPRMPAEVYAEVYGMSGTFTGQPSRWQDWFGPRSMKAWEAGGGPEVLARMGYECTPGDNFGL